MLAATRFLNASGPTLQLSPARVAPNDSEWPLPGQAGPLQIACTDITVQAAPLRALFELNQSSSLDLVTSSFNNTLGPTFTFQSLNASQVQVETLRVPRGLSRVAIGGHVRDSVVGSMQHDFHQESNIILPFGANATAVPVLQEQAMGRNVVFLPRAGVKRNYSTIGGTSFAVGVIPSFGGQDYSLLHGAAVFSSKGLKNVPDGCAFVRDRPNHFAFTPLSPFTIDEFEQVLQREDCFSCEYSPLPDTTFEFEKVFEIQVERAKVYVQETSPFSRRLTGGDELLKQYLRPMRNVINNSKTPLRMDKSAYRKLADLDFEEFREIVSSVLEERPKLFYVSLEKNVTEVDFSFGSVSQRVLNLLPMLTDMDVDVAVKVGEFLMDGETDRFATDEFGAASSIACAMDDAAVLTSDEAGLLYRLSEEIPPQPMEELVRIVKMLRPILDDTYGQEEVDFSFGS